MRNSRLFCTAALALAMHACTETSTPLPAGPCPPEKCVPPLCAADEWLCGSGECIPSTFECEGWADCTDGSDEDSHCPVVLDPLPPANLVVQMTSSNLPQLTLSWDPVPGATLYHVHLDSQRPLSTGGLSPQMRYGFRLVEGALPIETAATTQTLTGLVGGWTYHAFVTSVNTHGFESAYSNSVVIDALPEVADIYEVDNDTSSAKTLLPTEFQLRSFTNAVDTDYVVFDLVQRSDVAVEMPRAATSMTFYVYDSAMLLLGEGNIGAGVRSHPAELWNLAAGRYYVHVAQAWRPAFYEVTLRTAPPIAAPSGITVTAGVSSVAVTWNEVAGATAYRVHYEGIETPLFADEGDSPIELSERSLVLTGFPSAVVVQVEVASFNGTFDHRALPIQVTTW